MDKLDFDLIDENSFSNESKTNYGFQESVPSTYFDGNSGNLAYFDQTTQFGVNYSANFSQVELSSFQSQNMVTSQMNS